MNSGLSGKDNGARAFFFPRTPIFFPDHFIFRRGEINEANGVGFAMADAHCKTLPLSPTKNLLCSFISFYDSQA
jgi:hypothetical protein